MASPPHLQVSSGSKRHSRNASYNRGILNGNGPPRRVPIDLQVYVIDTHPAPLARRMTRGPLDSDEYACRLSSKDHTDIPVLQ